MLSVFMPITSNWIWPRMGTPWMVIFFISTMFISMALGIICIKIYQHINRLVKAYDVIQELTEKGLTPPSSTSIVVNSLSDGESKGNEVNIGDGVDVDVVPRNLSSGVAGGQDKNNRPQPKHVWLKYLHGFFMFYSFVMILGAAGAFGSNARTSGFPYQRGDETDQVIGRCYGRNLATNSTGSPNWLSNLNCGHGAWCSVQSATNSDVNPYSQNPY